MSEVNNFSWNNLNGSTTCMYKNYKLILTNYYYISVTNTPALRINKNTSKLCNVAYID